MESLITILAESTTRQTMLTVPVFGFASRHLQQLGACFCNSFDVESTLEGLDNFWSLSQALVCVKNIDITVHGLGGHSERHGNGGAD